MDRLEDKYQISIDMFLIFSKIANLLLTNLTASKIFVVDR